MAIQTRLEDMVIGDKIVCNATTGNSTITLEKLGQSMWPLVSAQAYNDISSVGVGFYFIYVGNDFKGRKLLIADRNVFHTISWDKLNTMGIATKDGIEITTLGLDSTQWKTNIRLLTGGTSDATKANSEWDKYIVNGPVGSDNATWNWSGISSWSSTTATISANKVVRGKSTVSGYPSPTGYATSTAAASIGFRPVLVAESLVQPIKNKFLIQDGEEIKKYSESAWQLIGSVPATKEMFDAHGSDFSDSAAFNRLNATQEKPMSLSDKIIDSGKVFSHSIDLSKYADIRKLNVTSR